MQHKQANWKKILSDITKFWSSQLTRKEFYKTLDSFESKWISVLQWEYNQIVYNLHRKAWIYKFRIRIKIGSKATRSFLVHLRAWCHAVHGKVKDFSRTNYFVQSGIMHSIENDKNTSMRRLAKASSNTHKNILDLVA